MRWARHGLGLIAIGLAVLIAIFLWHTPIAQERLLLYRYEGKKQYMLSHGDSAAILTACRALMCLPKPISDRSVQDLLGDDYYDPKTRPLPKVLRDLDPCYISVTSSAVVLTVGLIVDRRHRTSEFGYVAYGEHITAPTALSHCDLIEDQHELEIFHALHGSYARHFKKELIPGLWYYEK